MSKHTHSQTISQTNGSLFKCFLRQRQTLCWRHFQSYKSVKTNVVFIAGTQREIKLQALVTITTLLITCLLVRHSCRTSANQSLLSRWYNAFHMLQPCDWFSTLQQDEGKVNIHIFLTMSIPGIKAWNYRKLKRNFEFYPENFIQLATKLF